MHSQDLPDIWWRRRRKQHADVQHCVSACRTAVRRLRSTVGFKVGACRAAARVLSRSERAPTCKNTHRQACFADSNLLHTRQHSKKDHRRWVQEAATPCGCLRQRRQPDSSRLLSREPRERARGAPVCSACRG